MCIILLLEYSLGYGTLQGTLQSKRADTDDINIYRPVGSPDKGLYDRHDVPQGAYPSSSHVTYDGHYIYDHEAPPRPPLPPGVEGKSSGVHDSFPILTTVSRVLAL